MTATLTDEKYDAVTEALKDVMDPELGINVVDL
ncbi:iron-sulfur cluster assembly protein, partial [Acinetobacter baumannii]